VSEAVKAKIYPNSYAALLRKRQQEPWYDTTFYDNNTHQAQVRVIRKYLWIYFK
jgi:hypothetical protein